MKKLKYLFSFIFAFCAGFLIMNYNGNGIATRIPDKNINEENYYKDYDGTIWEDKNHYEEYRDDKYFQAPDGSYWINEYRYDQSKM